MTGYFFRKSGAAVPVVLMAGAVFMLLYGTCKTAGEAARAKEPADRGAASERQQLPAEIISPLKQSVVYNGRPQPVDARSDRDVPLVVTYYPSLGAWWFDEDGTREAPVNAGLYYVKINRPAGNGYARGEDVMVEYSITKAVITIKAEKVQSASYNGDPKRVQASSEPQVPLSFSYYPAPEVRAAAVKALSQPDENALSGISTALRGLKRVERAPIEQGVYYVVVYYPGDDNHFFAYAEVDFTIGPPVRRN
ncbi:MAG: hypothetical protein LBC62_09335 [Treponema sp.]|jgi:hypothetical protein|nr:hypothetical protein [Treponema sp.]